MENRLGVRLFNRTTRKLNITVEGNEFHSYCQQIISDAEQITLLLSGKQKEPTGLLRISYPTDFKPKLFQQIISEYLTLYPNVQLEIDCTNRKVDLIEEGFDLVIRATKKLDDSTLICKKLSSSKALTVASPIYIEKWGKPLLFEDLEYHKCISYSYSKTPNIWSFKEKNGKNINVKINSFISSNDSSSTLALCKAGHGIAKLPSFRISDELETGSLISLFEGFPHDEISIYLIYPSKKHLSEKVRAFIHILNNNFIV